MWQRLGGGRPIHAAITGEVATSLDCARSLLCQRRARGAAFARLSTEDEQ